ncbi:MAG: hypothetical protein CMH60_07495 [Myxococcales bacterium]|nr:hypothetical protein [Myxococcales bacterium]
MADKDKPITLDDDDFSLIEEEPKKSADKQPEQKKAQGEENDKFFSAPTMIDEEAFSNPEHTIIDPEIAERFMNYAQSKAEAAKEPEETSATEDIVEDSPSPEESPTTNPKEASASESTLLQEDVEVDRLLPEEDSRLGDGPINVEFSDSLMNRENTSPGLEIPTGVSSLKPEEDDWDDLDQSQPGWKSITGESDVKMIPEEVWEKSYARKGTDVYDTAESPAASPKSEAKVKKQHAARMIGLKGKDSSKEFEIVHPQTSLGRGSSNDIVLKDASISRNHARIQRDRDGFMIVDQRSGNGTFVNGQKISQNRLRSGDEFTLGKATFRFLEIGDVFKSQEKQDTGAAAQNEAAGAAAEDADSLAAHRPQHALKSTKPYFTYMIISACIFIVAMSALGIIMYQRHQKKDQAHQALVTQTYYDGIERFKEKKWKEAEQKFLILASLDKNQTSSKRYLERIKHEKEMMRIYNEAQRDFEREFLGSSFAKCKEIKDSVYEADARKLQEKIPAAIPGVLKSISKRIDRGRVENAIKKLSDMSQVWPKEAGINRLKAKALRIRGEQSRRAQEQQQEAKENPKSNTSKGALASSHLSTVIQAKALFADNKINDAIALLSGTTNASAKKVHDTLVKIQEILPRALEQHRLKRPAVALKIFNEIYRYTLELADPESSFAINIRQKIADMHCLAGIQANLSGNLASTYQSLKSALTIFPQHRLAQRKMDELQTKAKKLLNQAQNSAEPASAKRDLQLVMQISSPESTTYQKAKAALEKLP